MNGYIGVTDPSWYDYLSLTPGPKDVNFWRPSTEPRSKFTEGMPFFFKRKRADAIVGFGFYAGFIALSEKDAWDLFGDSNGAATFLELSTTIRKIRIGRERRRAARKPKTDTAEDSIGCTLIADTHFFAERNWVAAPRDWEKAIVVGMKYDLRTGEGARVWKECLQRVKLDLPVAPKSASDEEQRRFGNPTLYQPRLGQAVFRMRVSEAYGRTCAIVGERSLPVLEAAHIVPFAHGGENHVTNGLLLRSDLHRLFDRGYIAVDKKHQLLVSRRLRDTYNGGQSYVGLRGRPLALPTNLAHRPSKKALEWHRSNIFQR